MLNKQDKLVIQKTNKAIDYKSLSLGYASLIGDRSLQLYLQLIEIANLDLGNLNMQIVEKISGFSLSVVEKSRFNLEKYGLVKTYKKDNEYLIKLIAPLDLYSFLSHEVYGRLFIHKNGKDTYTLLMNTYRDNKFTGYVDVSSDFNELFGEEWDLSKEETYKNNKFEQVKTKYQFDFEKCLGNNFEIVWPKKYRTQSELNEIARLSNLYALDEKIMRRLIGDNIDIKTKKLDIEGLKKACANSTKIGDFSSKNVYELPPKLFLKKMQPNAPISKVDQEVIEMLIDDYHFSNEVCNKLIEYALAKSNYRLSKKFVSAIASTWARANIDSLQKADKMIDHDNKKATYDFKNPYATLNKPKIDKDVINGKVNKMQKCNNEFDDF